MSGHLKELEGLDL